MCGVYGGFISLVVFGFYGKPFLNFEEGSEDTLLFKFGITIPCNDRRRMLWSFCLFTDAQGALVERLGFLILALILVQQGRGVQGLSCFGEPMLGGLLVDCPNRVLLR